MNVTAEHEAKKSSAPRKRATPPRRVTATEALESAAKQLTELLGRAPESVSGLRPTEQGWEAQVEVVELERIPETASVMASYQVILDPEGQLLAYQRDHRYSRAQVDRGNATGRGPLHSEGQGP
ncbi:gas vesicle protein [Streptomyces kaniharaensis]|uniref:Gas vesicle protein n=1 Tax=Streptomyces kaniharaensis TaxID=212423 RepID=A0A6N7L2B3_9ACTN|nr:gas vesicle protein [Streptomyces kaniharaensis]